MTTRVAHQVLATLGYGDAIGHEVLGIQRVLREAGFRSDVFVETADPRLEHLTRDFRELPDDSHPDHLLVHHFSLGSKASRVAFALPDRMGLIYHNITPPEYFVGINKHLVEQCYKGRRELGAYTRRVMMALGDSDYNRKELEHLGFPATGVLPVVPSFPHLDLTPDARLAQDFDDEWTNVLFVGRVIPNKKFDAVIRFFHVYKRDYNPRSRLLLVGAHSGFERYLVMLHHLVAKLGVPDVHFLGHLSNEQLTALYEAADLFLCASEHEGFCVPLVEAFYKDVPVIAYAATAVPATLDGAGVLYADEDQDYVAALMDGVVSNARLRDAIIDGQRQALARLLGRDFAATLLVFVDQALGAPGVPHPGVASDLSGNRWNRPNGGVKGENAVQVGQRLLNKFGGLTGLHRAPFAELKEQHGLGDAKAAQIKAAIELGRRLTLESPEERPSINSPADAAALVSYEKSALEQEHLRVIILDRRNRVLGTVEVYKGSVNSSQVRVGEVFKEAIRKNASAIIIIHNHPSGDPTPSPDDVAVTRAIVQAGKMLDVEVLDHMVIGQGRWVSLKERGLGFV